MCQICCVFLVVCWSNEAPPIYRVQGSVYMVAQNYLNYHLTHYLHGIIYNMHKGLYDSRIFMGGGTHHDLGRYILPHLIWRHPHRLSMKVLELVLELLQVGCRLPTCLALGQSFPLEVFLAWRRTLFPNNAINQNTLYFFIIHPCVTEWRALGLSPHRIPCPHGMTSSN